MYHTDNCYFGELYRVCQNLRHIYCDEKDQLIKRININAFKVRVLNIDKNTRTLAANAPRFDGKINKEVNGYRSVVKVTEELIARCAKKGEKIVSDMSNANHVKEYLKAWTSPLNTIDQLLEIAVEIMLLARDGMLYPDNPDCQTEKVKELNRKLLNLDVTSFYGELLGFHLKGDCSTMGRLMNIGMAYYADFFGGTLIEKALSLKKLHYGYYYATNNEFLANRVVEASNSMQVDFAQSFYNMAEFPLVNSVKILPKVSTSHLMNIVFKPLETPQTNNNLKFKVPLPSAYIDNNFVHARLISPFRTVDMLGTCRCISACYCDCDHTGPSDTIMFHVHGGGFVSQTSQAHLDYLHLWATQLNIPILSIDYTTAPQAPFPRALEEVFYCYVWMLNNFNALGTTGKKIVFSGDSAGGNLVTSLTLKTITNSIRIPDSLVLSYAALLIQFYPSPSRLLTLIDPLLKASLMIKCLNAYKDPNYLKSLPRSLEDELEPASAEDTIFMSPLLADRNLLRKFPRTLFIETDVDACLDENVKFSTNLIDAGVEVSMEVMEGLPHGFLAFIPYSKDCQQGVQHITKVLSNFIHQT